MYIPLKIVTMHILYFSYIFLFISFLLYALFLLSSITIEQK